jgi:hypothetical protein
VRFWEAVVEWLRAASRSARGPDDRRLQAVVVDLVGLLRAGELQLVCRYAAFVIHA